MRSTSHKILVTICLFGFLTGCQGVESPERDAASVRDAGSDTQTDDGGHDPLQDTGDIGPPDALGDDGGRVDADVDAATDDDATDTPPPPTNYTLTISTSGDGAGTVRSDGGELDCPSDCEAEFAEGSSVTLTAQPASDSVFVGWTGACSGDSACTFTVDGELEVEARFRLESTMWTSVARGISHTCGTRRDGSLWCWGMNEYGRLGDGTTMDQLTPTRVGTASDWVSVTAGVRHSCALRNDSSLWCWGDNSYGQLGDGSKEDRHTPVEITPSISTGGWESVDAGPRHTCGIRTDNSLWCWGHNIGGQLGDGTYTKRDAPRPIASSLSWESVTAGYMHTCAVSTDDTLWCWGDAGEGRLGVTGEPDYNSPMQVSDDKLWGAASAGEEHTCGIDAANTLWCWGRDTFNTLGDKSNGTTSDPVQVTDATSWTHVSAGNQYSCALRDDDTLWCWGWNSYGQLGDGSTTTRSTPVRVGQSPAFPSGWRDVSALNSATCAIDDDAVLWCWGLNDHGELGDGTTTNRSIPTQVVVP